MGVEVDIVYQVFHEGINEVIASTCLNAAPMGIIRKESSLSVIVYKTSHTAQNLLKDNWMVAHITRDPVLFVKTAFEDPGKDFFVKDLADKYEIYRINGIKNWIAFRTDTTNISKDKIYFSLQVIKAEISDVLPTSFHRGFSNLIEATIHGTRYILTKDPDLEFLIKHHGNLVMRCGGPDEKEALNLLFGYLNKGVNDKVFALHTI